MLFEYHRMQRAAKTAALFLNQACGVCETIPEFLSSPIEGTLILKQRTELAPNLMFLYCSRQTRLNRLH
jgi:hypothetical protein